MDSLERPFESWQKAEGRNKKNDRHFKNDGHFFYFPKAYCVNENEDMISEKTDDSVVILNAGGGVV